MKKAILFTGLIILGCSSFASFANDLTHSIASQIINGLKNHTELAQTSGITYGGQDMSRTSDAGMSNVKQSAVVNSEMVG